MAEMENEEGSGLGRKVGRKEGVSYQVEAWNKKRHKWKECDNLSIAGTGNK
jgi:hypothetical protein